MVMAITGASGAPYARLLLRALLDAGLQVHLLVSHSAIIVMREEMGIEFPNDQFDPAIYLDGPVSDDKLVLYDERDLAAGPASGSFRHGGMVICPCSMKTLATVAHGTGSTLITRAADACLKERRKLVLVPRETPLSLIHLKNMVAVTEAGAIVLPAMPGFYSRPNNLEELQQHLVLKIMDSLGLAPESNMRWKD